jgi:hypothetical protein
MNNVNGGSPPLPIMNLWKAFLRDCWYNPKRLAAGPAYRINFEIVELRQLRELVTAAADRP